jgi:hypothetical protein
MRRSNRALTWLATAAAAVGISVGVAGLAGAATGSSSTGSGSTATTPAAPQAPTNAPDPATVDHGPGETLLTGDTAAKVTAAAKAAVPGATVIRVETDSDGAAYEAHLQKSDGSFVTIKLDKSFKVTATETGFGGGPGGHHGDGDGDGPGAPGSSGSGSSGSGSSGTTGA